MDVTATEIINVTRDVSWLPWAVQYFFLIGVSVSAFLLAAPGLLFGLGGWQRLGRVALIVALTTGIAAPVALLADLHQPFRFYHFYLYFTPWSWMSWGSLFLPAYVGGVVVFWWLSSRPVFAAQATRGGLWAPVRRVLAGGWLPGWVPGWAGFAVGLFTLAMALLVALYTGMEVMVVRSRPLWDTPFLPVQFLLTGLSGALGLVMLFNVVLGPRARAVETRANRLLVATLAATGVVGLAWFAIGVTGLGEVHARALDQVMDYPQWQMTAVWAVLATLIPLGLALWRPAGTGWLTGLIAVHSAWMFRWTVFMGAQAVPKTGAGLYDYAMPTGSEGWLGIIGTAGLWLALVILIDTLTPLAGTPAARDAAAARPARRDYASEGA